jgi:hypothetical protein
LTSADPNTDIENASKTIDIASFIPKASELETSSYALHEWIGILWYKIRYGLA